MLDLDILLNHYTSISHIPISIRPAAPNTHENAICLFYTRNLIVEKGCSGYVVTDEYLFCGKIVQQETGTSILLGPATEYALPSDTIGRITSQMGISRKDARGMQAFLSNIPIASLSLFINHLSFLNYLINGKNDLPSQSALPRTASKRLHKSSTSDSVHHNTAQYENYLMRCIEHGRLDLIQSALEEVTRLGLNMGKVSSTSMNALKNIFITSTTLACRAAVQGGMDYDRAMSLSDAYLRKLNISKQPMTTIVFSRK